MVFLQVMGILFCIFLFVGLVFGTAWAFAWLHDLEKKVDRLDGDVSDTYKRLRELESETIGRTHRGS
jgi:hypothetical protein